MKYVLKGIIVTFNPKREVIRDGYLVVDGERIVYVSSPDEELSMDFNDLTIIETEGYIYPGLIDLHNHLPVQFP